MDRKYFAQVLVTNESAHQTENGAIALQADKRGHLFEHGRKCGEGLCRELFKSDCKNLLGQGEQ